MKSPYSIRFNPHTERYEVVHHMPGNVRFASVIHTFGRRSRPETRDRKLISLATAWHRERNLQHG